MGLFKSEEEKAAEQAERACVEAAQAAARAEAAKKAAEAKRRAGPVGQAGVAKEAGLRFYEVQLDVGVTQGSATFGEASGSETRSAAHPGHAGEIEALGWKLEHVGYVYQVTGEETTDKFVTTGQRVAVSGKTVGIYLFRNTSA
ncbi:hypothetical protein [Aeromicrobium sp. UC242_57]|uniref:hypothetical protein n=1 Tax=Aeromicrobium sp. UC242_57 TaxID=3374624 RepID=UPI00379F15A9